MWAGSLAHNDLTGCGTTDDWGTHNIEHELSGMFDVSHGAGLAAVWGSWARYVRSENLPRFVRFAVNVMGVEQDFHSPEATAEAGIRAMEDFYREVNMPTTLKELGITPTDQQIEEMAERCVAACGGPAGVVVPLYKEDMIKIYTQARS